MSHQVRFKIKGLWYKVRLFIQSSNRLNCVCCGEKRDGVKFRHIEPRKITDGLICYECLVLLSLGKLEAVEPVIEREIIIGATDGLITAVFDDFINPQESPYGSGETEEEATNALLYGKQECDGPTVEDLASKIIELEAELDSAKTGDPPVPDADVSAVEPAVETKPDAPPSPFELLTKDSSEADCEKCIDEITLLLKEAGMKDTDFTTWKDAYLAIPPKPATPETK